MKIHELYDLYKDKQPTTIGSETKDYILSFLSAIDKVESYEEAEMFIKILALCRKAQVAMDGERRINTIRTLLSAGEEGAYVENNSYINERFMYELIQNVDDCKYRNPKDCKLIIDFDIQHEKMVLAYNELGFLPKDVIAISDIGNSTKNHHKSFDKKENILDRNDLQEIGEKGIGFKSIFGLADKVYIESGCFRFYFDYNDFTIPKIIKNHSEKEIEGTKLTIFLKKGITGQLYKMLEKKYKKKEAIINENPVLFLNKLTEIIYRTNKGYFGFRASRDTGKYFINGEQMTIEYLSSKRNDCQSIQCYRYAKEIMYSLAECKARFGNDEEQPRTYRLEIIIPVDTSMHFPGRIYSFFPTEQKLSVPMIIQAPFKLDSSRTNIANQSVTADSSNLWFVRTKTETIQFIYHVLKDMAHRIGYRIISLIPENNLVINVRCPLYDSLLYRNKILELDLFESIDKQFLPAAELCYLDKPNISLEDAKEIYKLLNIKLPMVNEKPSQSLERYGFIPIKNIDNKLFQVALVNPEYTSHCTKYLDEYTPDSFKSDDIYILEMDQIQVLSSFSSIVDFINVQLIRRLRNEKAITFYVNNIYPEIPRDLIRVKKYCQENKDVLTETVYNFVNDVMFVQDHFWKKPVYLENCLFGTDVVKVFNILFNKISTKYKNFFSLIQIEESDKEIDRLIHDTECSKDEFFRELVKIRRAQKNILGRQYESIINLIGEMGTKPERFLMELLQNIDDCNFNEDPYAEFYLTNNKLTIFYNESGFTKENIASITAFGDSTKQYLKHEGVTGEKGIGFKSIFTVANNVEIHSNEFHFSLSSSEPTIPVGIHSDNIIHGTKMIINVKNGFIEDYFNEEYLCSICLCLKKVKKLIFNRKEMLIQDQKNNRIVTFENKYEYYRFVYHYKISDVLIRKARSKKILANKEQAITFLVPKIKQECVLYSTFPTRESMEVPVIVNADFKLTTSRERIPENSIWNQDVIKQIHIGFLWMLNQLKIVDYKKMADIIPYDGYLTTNFSNNHVLREKIKALPIFKVFNASNIFIALNDGYIANDLDKYIIKKWGYDKKPFRSNCIDFDLKKITYDAFYEGVNFVDYCKDLANPDSYNVIQSEYLEDDDFRKLLYEYIHSYKEGFHNSLSRKVLDEIGMKNWKIIPVIQEKKTQYVKYSNDIYYIEGHVRNISKKVLILDQDKMDSQLFDFIYCNLCGYNIKPYSETIIFDEIVNKINQYVELEREKNATQILKLFITDKRLFKECIKQRNDINRDLICLQTRDDRYLLKNECYLPIEDIHDHILDHVIIADAYLELAKALKVDKVDQIKQINNIFNYFTYNDLNRLCDLKFLNIEFYDALYLSMFTYGYNNLIDREVYMKLMNRISSETAKYNQDSFQDVTSLINSECLSGYEKVITKIFFSCPHHSLALDQSIKLITFDHNDILNDMRNDVLTRKMDDRCQMVCTLLDNCYYVENLKVPIIPIRLEGNNHMLLVNQNITSGHDIIESFKEFFQSYFSLQLNVTRDAERYTRDGYEQISTIDYTLDEEIKMTKIAERIDFDNVSKIKDFMCKPLHVNKKVVGGYARTCPICGAKVQTELTGMRLYKFKDNHNIYEFICCPNCYENFRYSVDFSVNAEDYQNNYLTFKGYVNGEEWFGNRIKIRLGHKAILNVMNKKKR